MRILITFILFAISVITYAQTPPVQGPNNFGLKNYCSQNAAYQAGFNDGKRGTPANDNYANDCAFDISSISEAYQNGYNAGKAARKKPNTQGQHTQRQCVKNSFGQQACGYGCIKTTTTVRCASKPGMFCIADNFGNTDCGYTCLKSIKMVRCSKNIKSNCAKDNFGNIKCGLNCKTDGTSVTCDKKE